MDGEIVFFYSKGPILAIKNVYEIPIIFIFQANFELENMIQANERCFFLIS